MKQLGRKFSVSHDAMLSRFKQIRKFITERSTDNAIDHACRVIENHDVDKCLLAWSGGKDSQVVRYVYEKVGGNRAVLFLPDVSVEWQVMQDWWALNKPIGTHIVRCDRMNLDYYLDNPAWFVRSDSKANDSYFRQQWQAQAAILHHLDRRYVIQGRRTIDGNACGKQGVSVNKRLDMISVNPLYRWSHELVFAVLAYKEIPLPPIYAFPNGFHLSTQRWIACQKKHEDILPFLEQNDPEACAILTKALFARSDSRLIATFME